MLVAFNIILDDIVFPDGRTVLGVLGGGGPQSAFGMRLFAESVGLVAEVGTDLPDSAWAWFHESGIDTSGVRVRAESRTPRAWQLTEVDGRRTQVWRVRPTGAISLPESYRNAQGYHLGVHPESPNLNRLAELRRTGLVSLETFRPALQALPPKDLSALLAAADIFSANLSEAQSLVGAGSVRGVARRLVEAAESRAQLVVLRLGAEGVMVVEGQTGQAVRLPAATANVVDVVGAGNAFCGGFLAGWTGSHDIARAGACGLAAASLAVEQVGVPVVNQAIRAEAEQRMIDLLKQADYTSL
jgi:sugar/nucleoside kinase (ribokinase family)